MRYFTFVIIVVFLTSGCDSQIENLVGSSSLPEQPISNITTSSNPLGVKLSPGANSVTGAQLKGRLTITTTKKVIKGTQVSAQISFHQNRTN